MGPFLVSLIWAMALVAARSTMMIKGQARLRHRALAVAVMSGAILLVFVVPLLLMVKTLVENADTITRWMGSLGTSTIPPPPDWVANIPVLGTKIAGYWAGLAAAGTPELAARL